MASFYVIRGKDNGQHFPIRGAIATIGRESVNQIRLRDTEVSRNHAKVIRTEDGGHRIADNGSSNGTYVNSRRVSQKSLQSGDRVQIGRTLMIYTGGPEPHPQSAADAVVIFSEKQPIELSHIRSSIEGLPPSRHARLAEVSRNSVLPADLRQPTSNLGEVQAFHPGEDALRASDADEQLPHPPAVPHQDSPASAATRLPEEHLEENLEALHSTGEKLTTDDWEIIYRVGQAISRTVDLDDLLNQVLDLIFEWIECDRGCVLMLDEVTGQLTPTYSRDRKSSLAPGQARRRLTISRTILDHVLASKEGVLTSNAQDDARWENVESIASLGVQEAICVPMLGRYGLVGAIYVDTAMSVGLYAERQGRTIFEHQHLELMLAIAGQAALAIEDTQFYRAMLQAERLAAMGQTIANLSHHVKNILQGVRGGSYLVDDGLRKQDFDVIRKGWAIVERNQDRIGNLVMDMLSFSKDREPELSRNDLRIVIDEVVELMLPRAGELNVELDWQRPPQPLLVDFDHEAMHRSILNVVTNAMDAAAHVERLNAQSPRVTVSVELSQLKNYVRIHVNDNGPGIADEDRAKVFSPFESTKGARGTGLGLPVSQKVLREHGGDIYIESQLGEGATFSLHWPAYRDKSTTGDGPDANDDWSNRATLES